jgi:hypothetical protein
MGIKLERVTREGGELYGHAFFCPGCQRVHLFDTRWSFNGSLEAPTFSPSLLCDGNTPERRCHSFVTGGRIQFLGDCHHALAGQTVEIPDWKGYDEDRYQGVGTTS